MIDVARIPVPLPHIGHVNTWLLRGEPLTLLDTGPFEDEALDALEAALAREGLRVEDIGSVLATHHHLDHTGLTATIAQRSGARVAMHDRVADYGAHYNARIAADRRFSVNLMRHHGVPDQVIADQEEFWEYIRRTSAPFTTDTRLSDGETIRAGGRDLRVVARPGHSTTDTLFVDEAAGVAFVGDHLLAGISSNTEVVPAAEPDGTRPRARVEYLANLRRTAAMPLERLLTGHGDPVTDHAALVHSRFGDHERRCERIGAALERGPASAYEIAGQLWSARTVAEQAVLVVWEVLGHLDLLLDAGAVSEHVRHDGSQYGLAEFRLRSDRRPAPLSFQDHRDPDQLGGGRPERASRHAH